MGIGGSYNTQSGYGANLSWGAEQNANRFGSVSGSLNWQNGGGMSVSSSYTLDNKEAAAEFLKKKAEKIEKGRKAGIEGTDDQVLAELSNRAKKAGEDNNSLTNDISKLLIGEFGGGLSTLFGRGSDATGYINDKGEYVVRTCFVAGTLIEVANGKKPIEEIKIGDYVYAINEKTGNKSLKKVTQTYIRKTNEIYELTYQTGNKIETTWNHPFFIEGKGWTEVKDIKVRDHSVTINGESIDITNIKIDNRDETVYNFTVEDEHNYYVGEDGVLVHNVDYKELLEKAKLYGIKAIELVKKLYGTYDNMNEKEIHLLLDEWLFKNEDALEKAYKVTKIAEATTLLVMADGEIEKNAYHNGRVDAFKHAFWNALMTKTLGYKYSGKQGDAHEWIDPKKDPLKQPIPLEVEMDLFNNNVGRKIITQSPWLDNTQLTFEILEAIKKGEMLMSVPKKDFEIKTIEKYKKGYQEAKTNEDREIVRKQFLSELYGHQKFKRGYIATRETHVLVNTDYPYEYLSDNEVDNLLRK